MASVSNNNQEKPKIKRRDMQIYLEKGIQTRTIFTGNILDSQ